MRKNILSKEFLLSVAYTIVEKEGPASLTVRKVANNAKISIGSVYNYFESKEALILALIDKLWNDFYFEKLENVSEDIHYDTFLIEAYDSFFTLTHNTYNLFQNHFSFADFNNNKSYHLEKHNQQKTMIYNLFFSILEKDPRVDSSIWNDTLTPSSFNWFVVNNFFSYIKRRESNIHILIEIIRSVIYKKHDL